MAAARARSRADRGDAGPKPRSDAYVGLLGLSLLALGAAMLFAFLNWNTYPEGKPKPVQMAPRAAGPAGGPAVNPPAGGNPPAPPAGGVPPAPPAGGMQGAPPPAPPMPPVPPAKQ